MGIQKKFNQVFGIQTQIDDEKRGFVNRINQIIFRMIDTERTGEFEYGAMFEHLCFEMGLNADDVWRKHRRKSDYILDDKEYAPEIRSITNDDFDKTLLILCTLYLILGSSKEKQKWLSSNIQNSLSRSTCDLGVRWKDGFFYPSGAKELDETLVDETLGWLSKYPDEKKDYQKALEFYIRGTALTDVVRNCYTAVEGLARNVLGNSKTLDNNKAELLKKMVLSDGWKSILSSYINYAHEFRHASESRHDIAKQEVEAYLYMTGLIIRLVLESQADQS